MNRTGRGVIGNKPASGTEIIQELGEEHQRTGKWIVYTSADSVFQIAAHEETIPLEELYAGCRTAREILTGKHAVGRVIARPFVGEPGHYERTPNRHDFSLEPRRPNYLTAIRDAGHTVYGVGKISDIFAGCDIDESFPTKSNVEGINRTIELLENIDSGLVFVNLVETDMLWGHRNDPVNFHRCLQDFDRRLPDILDALRDGDLLILTLRSRLRPDHAVDRPLARARAAARLRRGQERGREDPRGRRVRRRRRDRLRLARGEAPGQGRPGPPDRREVRIDDPARSRASTRPRRSWRRGVRSTPSRGPDPREIAFDARGGGDPKRVLEVGWWRPASLAERIDGRRGTQARHPPRGRARGELASIAGAARRAQASRSRTHSFDCVGGGVDAVPRPEHRPRPRRARTGAVPGGRLVATTNGRHLRRARASIAGNAAWGELRRTERDHRRHFDRRRASRCRRVGDDRGCTRPCEGSSPLSTSRAATTCRRTSCRCGAAGASSVFVATTAAAEHVA